MVWIVGVILGHWIVGVGHPQARGIDVQISIASRRAIAVLVDPVATDTV